MATVLKPPGLLEHERMAGRHGLAIMRCILFGALCLYAVFIARTRFDVDGNSYFTLYDDAMISMRYAQNLAGGDGLVWNPGEHPVEGYTNPLWTACMTIVHVLPIHEGKRSLAVMIMAAGCLLVCTALAGKTARLLAPHSNAPAIGAMVLTAFYFPLVFWSLRGMEVGLLAMFLSVAILLAFRLIDHYQKKTAWAFGALLAASLLVRPDALIPVVVIAAFTAWRAPAEGKRQLIAVASLMTALAIAGLTVFRVLYFHDILPNTYYLKLRGTPLPERLMAGASLFLKTMAVHLWLLVPVLAALILPSGRRFLRDRRSLLVLPFFAQCAYSIAAGGDFEEHLELANRYVAVAMPPVFVFLCVQLLGGEVPGRRVRGWLAICVACGVTAIAVTRYGALHLRRWGLDWHEYQVLAVVTGLLVIALGAAACAWLVSSRAAMRMRAVTGPLLLALVFASFNAFSFRDWVLHNVPEVRNDTILARLGLEIRRRTPLDTVIAVVWAGQVPYWAQRESVDLLGKNDPVIARSRSHSPFKAGHSKWDYPYSVDTYRPDLILQTWRLARTDREYLARAGYQRTANGIYVDTRSSGRVEASQVESIVPPMKHLHEEK